VERIAESGQTAADEMLGAFAGRWGAKVDAAYSEHLL